MTLTEYQRHEVLRDLLPSMPQQQLAARILQPTHGVRTTPAANDAAVDSRGGSQAILARVVHVISAGLRQCAHAWERRSSIVELRRLSPELLADIGIESADIERVVDSMMAARKAARVQLPAKVAAEFVDRG